MTTDTKASDVEAREAEAFQAAHPGLNFRRNDKDGECRYWNSNVDAMWRGWLARASQQPSAQWIAVSERLPHESARVLVVCDDEPEPLGARYLGSSHGWMPSPGNYELEGVTHWQPLPAAPDTARAE